MPALDNHKHELFAQAIAAGKGAEDALEAAGYVPNARNGTRMKKKEEIQNRIEELQDKAAESCLVTMKDHLKMLEELRDKAAKDSSWAAAINAETHRGKASGLYVERTENVNKNYDVTPDPMPADDWEQTYTDDATH